MANRITIPSSVMTEETFDQEGSSLDSFTIQEEGSRNELEQIKEEIQDGQNILFKKSIKEIQNKFEEEQNKFKEEQNKFKNENKIRNKKIDDLEKRVQSSNSQAFAILSIFTAVFAFLFTNISIFQKVQTMTEAVFFISIFAFFCAIIVSIPLLILQSINGYTIKDSKVLLLIFEYGLIALLLVSLIATFTGLGIDLKDS
jgi:gas vesicle protein